MSHALVLLAGLITASDPAVTTITNGTFDVTVSPTGLLVAGPTEPYQGLLTLDGPRLLLDPGFHEWLGLAFDIDGKHVEASATGTAEDWTDRSELVPVSMESTEDEARVVTRIDDLEVHTTFHFDRDQPDLLLVHVELHNRGVRPIQNVLICREWRTDGTAERGWTFPYDIRGMGAAPDDICRLAWMTDDIPAGDRRGVRLSYRAVTLEFSDGTTRVGVDVPLQLWTNVDFPSGLNFGATNGISIGDYDADGFIDVFACESGNLWRNEGGTTWSLAQNLDGHLPPTARRYGSSFGDYNEDGLPDIGTEPREGFGGDECYHLLKNLDGDFIDVATDSDVLDVQPCGADSETICWADVNGDGWMDCFLPVYPAWAGSGPGNFFMQNLGPTGPGGIFRFTENVDDVGLDNPPGSARPEGAQFVDLDYDGDVELYCNGTLYQNNSTVSTVSFDAMTEAASGIGFSTSLEEGAAYVDYDLDGDQDLLIVYTSPGVRIFEGLGDGTHFEADQSIIQSPFTGLNLGLSAEDWDNDGDIDFTTRDVFRRNQLMETGTRLFTVATTTIPLSHRTSATPAWGDWDKDGDLDCMLGNWLSTGRFYENTTADAIPPADRRYVRVKVLREDDTVTAGLENEYGAFVEIHVAGEKGVRRRKVRVERPRVLEPERVRPPFRAAGTPGRDRRRPLLRRDRRLPEPSRRVHVAGRQVREQRPRRGSVSPLSPTGRSRCSATERSSVTASRSRPRPFRRSFPPPPADSCSRGRAPRSPRPFPRPAETGTSGWHSTRTTRPPPFG